MKGRIRGRLNIILSPKSSFLDVYKKKPTHPLFGAWLLFLVHVRFTPSHGRKCFENAFLWKLDHGSMTMEKCSLTRDNFMVHDVNNP